ncbi:hypothetical protein PR048_025971 [Dryococelus australis]|uniref:Uncharacterized protein n=1 Tax=Dryococelus australis TaxID=614101 RepID=A0ABQ9GK32_9NEOP|nr:hypothetical protein PR048_025971 [Dryococelus australis]
MPHGNVTTLVRVSAHHVAMREITASLPACSYYSHCNDNLTCCRSTHSTQNAKTIQSFLKHNYETPTTSINLGATNLFWLWILQVREVTAGRRQGAGTPTKAHVARAVDDHHNLQLFRLLQYPPVELERVTEVLLCVQRHVQVGVLDGRTYRNGKKSPASFAHLLFLNEACNTSHTLSSGQILTLCTVGTIPSQITVALFPGGGGGTDINALSMVATVVVVYALVTVLAARAIVQPVAAALGQQVASVPAAVLLELRPCPTAHTPPQFSQHRPSIPHNHPSSHTHTLTRLTNYETKSTYSLTHIRLPPRRTRFNSRLGNWIFASGNRAGRCHWSVGFLWNLPFPPSFHSGAATYSRQSPSSALKTSLLRAAQISSLTHSFVYFSQNLDLGIGWMNASCIEANPECIRPCRSSYNNNYDDRHRVTSALATTMGTKYEVSPPRRSYQPSLLTWHDVDVGAGPEAVAGGPLLRLPHQPDGAVFALKVRWQLHWVRLRTATTQHTFHGTCCPLLSVVSGQPCRACRVVVPYLSGLCDSSIRNPPASHLKCVTERLTSTKTSQVRLPVEPLSDFDFRTWELCRMIPLVDGFLGGSLISPVLAFRCCSKHLTSPSLALKNLVLRAHGKKHVRWLPADNNKKYFKETWKKMNDSAVVYCRPLAKALYKAEEYTTCIQACWQCLVRNSSYAKSHNTGYAQTWWVVQWCNFLDAVAKRLARSPPTKANMVPSQAGSPDFRMWASCRTMPLIGGFSRGSPVYPRPFIPSLLHIHLSLPHRLSRPRCQEPSRSLFNHSLGKLKISVKGNTQYRVVDDKATSTEFFPGGEYTERRGRRFPFRVQLSFAGRVYREVLYCGVYTFHQRETVGVIDFLLTQTLCFLFAYGATVVELLACSPPTRAIRAQSPAGSLRTFACGNRAGRCRWSAGLLGDLPFPPPFHSGAAPYSPQSPLSALTTSDVKSRPNLFARSLTHSFRVRTGCEHVK